MEGNFRKNCFSLDCKQSFQPCVGNNDLFAKLSTGRMVRSTSTLISGKIAKVTTIQFNILQISKVKKFQFNVMLIPKVKKQCFFCCSLSCSHCEVILLRESLNFVLVGKQRWS